MIPHPLTLLLCWLIGTGLSEGLGYVLEFLGQLGADAVRAGALGPMGQSALLSALALLAAFAGSFFTGAAMRLWADKPWPKAALWGVLTIAAVGAINSSIPLRLYPAAGLAVLGSWRFWLATPLGCAAGAYAAGLHERDARVEAVRDAVRGFIVWER